VSENGEPVEGHADGQVWLNADYVMAWFGGDKLPALITTSPPGTPKAMAGIPGFATTRILFGNDTVNDDLRSGFRLGGGWWFTPERTLGIEAGFMLLECQSSGFSATSNGSTTLARPFFNVSTGAADAALVAAPGSSAGSVAARDRSGEFYEAHVDLTENVFDCGWARLDSLLGYRFYRYDDGLSIAQVTTNSPNFAAGTVFRRGDDFATQNEFHGGDLGFRTHFAWETLSLDVLTKIAVGMVDRTVKISGGQVIAVPGAAPLVQSGGLLALASNIGNDHTDDWTILPELGANLGWQVTPNVRVRVGYTVMWLDRIARAGDQIDLDVNPTLFPNSRTPVSGPLRPAFVLIRNDTWLQSLNIGVEVSF